MAHIAAGRPQNVQKKPRQAVRKPSKRPRADSTSASSSGSSTDGDDDKAGMLAALQAHNRAMLGLDGPDEAESSAQGRRRMSASGSDASDDGDSEDDGDGDEDEEEDAEGFSSDDGWGEGDEMVSDSEDEVLQKAVAPVTAGECKTGPSLDAWKRD